jgi:hypothetical protein
LPLPADLTVETRKPVAPGAVQPWLDLVERLCFDQLFYDEAVARTRTAAAMYDRRTLASQYVKFFENVLAAPEKHVR